MADENNPLVDQMVSDFGDEQLSVDALEGVKNDQGGTIQHQAGTVTVTPNGYGDELRKGVRQRADPGSYNARPSSLQMFAWNGVPSNVPIAYGPGGSSPTISRYLRKRHCNTCMHNGFIGRACTQCGSADVVSFYYLNYEQVPVKTNFYGKIACLCSQSGEMIGECPRSGEFVNGAYTGFLSQQQMLMHASSKHLNEYQIWQTMRQGGGMAPSQIDEMVAMRKEMAELKESLGEPVATEA